jgi:hypothetical protein
MMKSISKFGYESVFYVLIVEYKSVNQPIRQINFLYHYIDEINNQASRHGDVWVNGSTVPCILKLGTRWR